MNCQGITKKGTQCKNNTCSMYCHQHFTLYEHAEEWPQLHEIKNDVRVKTYIDQSEMYYVLAKLAKTASEKIYNRQIFILTCEILLKNQHFDYSGQQASVDTILRKLGEYSHLTDYVENFKRRFKSGYQQEARQRYVEHIFLPFIGIDMAHHIASFVE